MDQDQGVGREVKRLREAKGWSQTRLAAEADMSVSGISMIEHGHRNLTTVSLAKLAEALGVGVRDLFPLGQATLPDFEPPKGFDAWVLTQERYRSLRTPMFRFEELDAQERHSVFEKTLELLSDLSLVYENYESEDLQPDWELGFLHDALHQAALRMMGVYELELERGDAEASVVDIEKYKARLRRVA